MCRYVWLCVAMGGHRWLCVAMGGYRWLCVELWVAIGGNV